MSFALLLNPSRRRMGQKAIYPQGRQIFLQYNHWHHHPHYYHRSLSILVAGTTATLATTTTTTTTSKTMSLGRFQFKSFPRYYSIQDLSNLGDDDKDCPLCRKYGQGPCGRLFQTWRQCTKQHEETYLEDCAQQFEKLRSCLEQHNDYYDNDDDESDTSYHDDIMNEKQHAWQEFIEETLQDLKPQPFPTQPILQFQNHNTITACLVPSTNLIFVFVQDNNNKLLAAGSKADLLLHDENEWAILHFSLLMTNDEITTSSVTISAVYEQAEDSVVLYQQQEYSINAK